MPDNCCGGLADSATDRHRRTGAKACVMVRAGRALNRPWTGRQHASQPDRGQLTVSIINGRCVVLRRRARPAEHYDHWTRRDWPAMAYPNTALVP